MNGAWLALTGMAALSVIRGVRQGSATQITELTDAQLADYFLLLDLLLLRDLGEPGQWLAVQNRLHNQGLDLEDFTETDLFAEKTRRQDAWLREQLGGDVGLNADWATSAWHLGSGPRPTLAGPRWTDSLPNRQSGDYYVTDDEDGSWSILRRTYRQNDNDHFDWVHHFHSFDALRQHLTPEQIKHYRGR